MFEGRDEFRAHWRALLGSTLGAAVGVVGLNAYSSGAFMPELIAKAGYSREHLATATLMLSAAVALFAPLMGQALDRWGPVCVIVAAVVGEAVGFCLLAVSPPGFGWYAGLLVTLALLGVGSTPPSFSRVIAGCFDRRRGMALGLMIGGLGITAITAPILMTKVIASLGWRGGYATLAGLVVLLGGSGVALIWSDGRGRVERTRTARSSGDTLAEGGGDWRPVRRPLYWLVLICFAAPALFGGGFLLHMISILRAQGFTASEAAQVQALIGISIVAGRCLSGICMDRIFAPYVAAFAFAISAVGTTLLLSTSGLLLCCAALGIGLTIGAELDILAYTLSRYFGVPSFGRLYSLAYSVMILAGGASPLLIARLSSGGNYQPAIVVCAAGLGAFAVLVTFLPRYQRRSDLAVR